LRPRRERPRRRAAEECDELAPLHSIISLARANNVGEFRRRRLSRCGSSGFDETDLKLALVSRKRTNIVVSFYERYSVIGTILYHYTADQLRSPAPLKDPADFCIWPTPPLGPRDGPQILSASTAIGLPAGRQARTTTPPSPSSIRDVNFRRDGEPTARAQRHMPVSRFRRTHGQISDNEESPL
jgi:hypothetical protein